MTLNYLILFSLLVTSAGAQTRVYYDKGFRTIMNSESLYYREFKEDNEVIHYTAFCYDTLHSKGLIYAGQHKSMANSLVGYIKNNGAKFNFKEEFLSMKAEIDFYLEGVLARRIVCRNGKILYAQVWADDGREMLVNGTGQYTHNEQASVLHEHYEDSVMTDAFEVRPQQGDTLFISYDEIAEPYGGYTKLVQDLKKILKYPGHAWLASKQGVVHIQFIVDKNGKLTEFSPLTKEGYNFEKKAVDKLAQLPAWKPAMRQGKPVKMKFVLPIKFQLK